MRYSPAVFALKYRATVMSDSLTFSSVLPLYPPQCSIIVSIVCGLEVCMWHDRMIHEVPLRPRYHPSASMFPVRGCWHRDGIGLASVLLLLGVGLDIGFGLAIEPSDSL